MNFLYLFTSLDGRINRAKWWVGTVILWVVGSVLLGILGGFVNLDLRFAIILAILVELTLFRLMYAVAAKRFQDRNKPGGRSLYGLIPWLLANLVMFVYVRTGELPSTASICGYIRLGVQIWFVIELGLLKGDPGPNRFGGDPLTTDIVYSVRDATNIIGGRLAAKFTAAAGAVIMAALCNAILWVISVPVCFALLLLVHNAERWAEPGILFKGAVLLIASAQALIGFRLATPFARLALRVWPVDPFGG